MNILNGKRTVANPMGETCAELYERLNAGYGMTLRNFQERFNARSETRFGMKRVATPKEVAIMEALYPAKREELKRVTATETPGAKAPPANLKKKSSRPTNLRMLSFWAMCILVSMGHAALIWYDCAILWRTPGAIAGGIVFVVVGMGLVLMSGDTLKDVSWNMLWFVGLLDACAWFVHVPAFTTNASLAYAMGAGETHIWFLSAIICLCSIASVYFYRETMIKPDKKAK